MRRLRPVTHQQTRTLGAVACLTLLHGRTPTLAELAGVFRCTKAAAHYRLRWLEKKGLWNPTARALTESGLRTALDGLGR